MIMLIILTQPSTNYNKRIESSKHSPKALLKICNFAPEIDIPTFQHVFEGNIVSKLEILKYIAKWNTMNATLIVYAI